MEWAYIYVTYNEKYIEEFNESTLRLFWWSEAQNEWIIASQF